MTRTNFDLLIRNAYYGPKHAGSFLVLLSFSKLYVKREVKHPAFIVLEYGWKEMTNTICENPLSVHTVQQKVVVSGKNEQYDVDLAGLST